jgi:flagellar basal-body rod modification protein FlgD
METNSVSNSQQTSQSSSSQLNSALGRDEFLKILVAQLENQDPTSPMDNSQFISQMAQFSTLEQMQQMSTAFSYTQAYALLGKSVSAQVTGDDGLPMTVSGTVKGVVTISGLPYLNIDGDYVSMTAPLSVGGQSADEALLQGAAMIGKYVTGTYMDASNAKKTISGTVDRLAIQNGSPVLYVGGHAVKLADITEIAASAPVPVG